MLKISKLADYAILALTHMARKPEQRFSAPELAEQTFLSLPTVSKILKTLTKSDILSSTRGMNGGYALVRAPQQVSIIEIITSIDGTMALTECTNKHKDCAIKATCSLQANWHFINQTVINALNQISLADMLSPLSNNTEAPL